MRFITSLAPFRPSLAAVFEAAVPESVAAPAELVAVEAQAGTRLNLNTATREQFLTIPAVGEQLIPYGLCALELLVLAAYGLRPSRATALARRGVMVVIVLGSVRGMVQHLGGNLEFVQETRPNADTTRLLQGAVSGVAPLLAPGILAVTALLADAAAHAVDYQTTPRPVTAPSTGETSLRQVL